ncbi:MAG TPA: cytochrome c [Anaerolineales bacterium]|nr:cytochrome c [Anaerolineales bacterium]
MPRGYLPALLILAAGLLAACGSKAAPFGDPEAGRAAFLTTCVTCHGVDGKGIPGLGKDLTTSEFLPAQTDEQMLAFLLAGRPASDPLNTTGVDMPPRGNNPAFTEDDLKNIIAYLRTIQP